MIMQNHWMIDKENETRVKRYNANWRKVQCLDACVNCLFDQSICSQIHAYELRCTSVKYLAKIDASESYFVPRNNQAKKKKIEREKETEKVCVWVKKNKQISAIEITQITPFECAMSAKRIWPTNCRVRQFHCYRSSISAWDLCKFMNAMCVSNEKKQPNAPPPDIIMIFTSSVYSHSLCSTSFECCCSLWLQRVSSTLSFQCFQLDFFITYGSWTCDSWFVSLIHFGCQKKHKNHFIKFLDLFSYRWKLNEWQIF